MQCVKLFKWNEFGPTARDALQLIRYAHSSVLYFSPLLCAARGEYAYYLTTNKTIIIVPGKIGLGWASICLSTGHVQNNIHIYYHKQIQCIQYTKINKMGLLLLLNMDKSRLGGSSLISCFF